MPSKPMLMWMLWMGRKKKCTKIVTLTFKVFLFFSFLFFFLHLSFLIVISRYFFIVPAQPIIIGLDFVSCGHIFLLHFFFLSPDDKTIQSHHRPLSLSLPLVLRLTRACTSIPCTRYEKHRSFDFKFGFLSEANGKRSNFIPSMFSRIDSIYTEAS